MVVLAAAPGGWSCLRQAEVRETQHASELCVRVRVSVEGQNTLEGLCG